MNNKTHRLLLIFIQLMGIYSSNLYAVSQDVRENARELVAAAMDYWRSDTSYTEVEMQIHRADWQRSMSMKSWTRGEQDALIIFTSPKADAGNATLKLDANMWIFTPRLNQVIKLPASMMVQSWMGSDFSYNDLAKSDQIINQFDHQLINTTQHNGHRFYTIRSIPKPDAPVVWGKQELQIRDDYILMKEAYYDQDMKLVKQLITTEVGLLGGKPFPLTMRMSNIEKPQQWTEIRNKKAVFNLSLPNYLFSLSNLRNPRRWKMP